MRVLLDTHILIWMLNGFEQLTDDREFQELFFYKIDEVYFSPLSIWEIELKKNIGKAGFQYDGREIYLAAIDSNMTPLPLYPKNCLKLEDVGLTGLYIMDCGALVKLAQLLGKSEDIRLLEARKKEVSKGLEQLWDEERGFYYNRRTDTGEFSRRIAPTNFYALFADGIPSGRLERIIREEPILPCEGVLRQAGRCNAGRAGTPRGRPRRGKVRRGSASRSRAHRVSAACAHGRRDLPPGLRCGRRRGRGPPRRRLA